MTLAKSPAPAALMPPQGFVLRGTVTAGPIRSAIFERTGTRDYVRVEEGGELQGWTLLKVARSEILLRAANQELAMKLHAVAR